MNTTRTHKFSVTFGISVLMGCTLAHATPPPTPSSPSTVSAQSKPLGTGLWSPEMVRQYVHNSDLQRRWAWSLLARHRFQGNEQILDIGSGDGKITADLSKFVPKGRVLGVDPSEAMLKWALKQYHPQDYPNLMFQKGSFSELNDLSLFDVIMSTCALHFSIDPVAALKEMKKHLKSSGQLWIVVPIEGNMALQEARMATRTSPQWKEFFTNRPPRKLYGADDYQNFFSQAGLKIRRLEKIETMDPFVDQEEFISWFKGVLPPIFPSEELLRRYLSELIQKYLELRPEAAGPEGVIYGHFTHLEIEATLEP